MSEETPEAEEFHPYVRLLLARMKSNPDDFFYEANAVPTENESFFTEAEEAALWKARREISLGRMHSKLMEQILKANEPKEDKYSTREQYKLDRDAYLAQQQQHQRNLAAQMNAQQSALMQSQLGGLAQGQQVYGDARLSMPTVANGGTGTTVTAELIKSLNKLVGR